MFYVDGGECFHGVAHAAEDPLNAGLGLGSISREQGHGLRPRRSLSTPRLRFRLRAECLPLAAERDAGCLGHPGLSPAAWQLSESSTGGNVLLCRRPGLAVESEPRCDLSQVSLMVAPLFYVLSPRRRENQAC